MNTTERGILAVNAGSSSLKLGLYALGTNGLEHRVRLAVTSIGQAPRFTASGPPNAENERELDASTTHVSALRESLDWIRRSFPSLELVGAGHRVVHGGTRFIQPTRITPQVVEELRQFNDLAPLHEPHNIRAIEALTTAAPGLAQVACFDTAFHSTVTGPAATFALPRSLTEGAIRRYGFHGLSYDYIAGMLPGYLGDAAVGRVIVAHLGHGASMCAVRAGTSIATTMSMTPLDGLPMGTRSGQVDPGVILYLQTTLGMTVEEVSHLLYYESGLLGMSGVSAYMEVLLASEDPHASEAVDYFVYACASTVGSLAAALGGLDAVVFTAGIGEQSSEIRRRIMAASAWLGVKVDERANEAHGPRISAEGSSVSCWVIPTDEEVVVARQAAGVLFPAS